MPAMTKHILDVPGFAPAIVDLPTVEFDLIHNAIFTTLPDLGWKVSRGQLGDEEVLLWTTSIPYRASCWESEVLTVLIRLVISGLYGQPMSAPCFPLYLSGTIAYLDNLEFDYTNPNVWGVVRKAIIESGSQRLTPLWLSQFCPEEAPGVDECYWRHTDGYVQLIDGDRMLTLPDASTREEALDIIKLFTLRARPKRSLIKFTNVTVLRHIAELSK